MALIGMLVAEMGFIWHPRRVDHGIDGEVELVSPDGAALNRVLLVQSEATERRFAGEDDDGFWWVCDESDRPHVQALTKMNWNDTQLDQGLPITIRAAHQVATILKRAPTGQPIAARYAHYM